MIMSKQAKTSATKSKQRKQIAKTPQVDSAIREYLATVVPNGRETDDLFSRFLWQCHEGIDAPLPEVSTRTGARRLFHMVLIAEWAKSNALEDMSVKFKKGLIDDT